MKQITFLSLQGNTMNSNIREIQEMIRDNYPECRFALIANNIDIADRKKIKKKKDVVKKHLKNAECIFSLDGTLPLSDWCRGYQAEKRILFMEPFDYLYKGIDNKNFLNKVMKGFTDVIIPGKGLTEYIQTNCDLSEINVYGDVMLPYVTSLQDKDCMARERARFDEKFPWCKGKKLIVFLSTALRQGQELILKDVSVKTIVENLPDNTVFVTNNETLFASSVELDKTQKQSFVFVRRLFRRNELARIADCLIIDDAYLWSCHSSADRNVYYYPYRKSNFMKYAKKNLREHIINDLPSQIGDVMMHKMNDKGIDFGGSVPLEDVLKMLF